jgi:hypothetical protein
VDQVANANRKAPTVNQPKNNSTVRAFIGNQQFTTSGLYFEEAETQSQSPRDGDGPRRTLPLTIVLLISSLSAVQEL